MKIMAGNSNKPLAEAIVACLHLQLTNASIKRFSDMEIFVEIHENVRGEDVFVIQSTSAPANDHLMETLVALDAQTGRQLWKNQIAVPALGESTPGAPLAWQNMVFMGVAGSDLGIRVFRH